SMDEREFEQAMAGRARECRWRRLCLESQGSREE
ncbi:hypothetical protein LCGC14_2636490, partial [marine sediment metagenome]